MTRPILIDTGPIVAILAESDEHHENCVAQLRELRVPLITCWPVITEAAWLLRAWPAAVARLLSSFGAGPFRLAALDEKDMASVAAILARYRTLGIQLADASLVHLAGREGIDTIFTLDKRDFSVLRPSRGKRFHLLP